MSYARQLLDTYPGTLNADAGTLAATIDAVNDCAQACAADADADMSEQNLTEMIKCIRLCLDCADVCTATAGVLSRQTTTTPESPGPCWRPAWLPARAAATSVNGMLSTTSTAASASRPADAASRPARNSWSS